jgi:hypothetical protein
MISLAQALIRERQLGRLDRLAQRKKAGVICWLCENCPDLIVNPWMHILQLPTSTGQNTPAQPIIIRQVPAPQPAPAENEHRNMLMQYSLDDLLRDWFGGWNSEP